jgi:putative transposase
VDTDGLLLGVIVHAADIQDADGLGDLLKRVKPLYNWLQVVFADSIYNRVAALLACFLAGLVLIIVRRLPGTIGFVVQPRRWVVERSLGWFGRWRRLSKDYEALSEVSEAMVTLAVIRLMLHCLAHSSRHQHHLYSDMGVISAVNVAGRHQSRPTVGIGFARYCSGPLCLRLYRRAPGMASRAASPGRSPSLSWRRPAASPRADQREL